MTKPGPSSTGTRPPGTTAGRPDPIGEDERPFAEFRRILLGVWRILALHRWKFFVPFCIASSVAFIVSLYSPRSYTATTTFERHTDPVGESIPVSGAVSSYKHYRNTVVQDLTSLEYMKEVVDNLGLTDDLERSESGEFTQIAAARRASLARGLASALKINVHSPTEYLDQIRITYTGPDPNLGKRLVEEARATYIRRIQDWILQYLKSQEEFFRNEMTVVSAELEAARRAETEFRMQYPLADPTNPGSIAIRITQFEQQKNELERRRRDLETDLSAQRELLASLVPPEAESQPAANADGAPTDEAGAKVPMSAAALKIVENLRETEKEITRLRSERGMTMAHPQIVELTGKRDRLQAELQHQRKQDRQALADGSMNANAPSLMPTFEMPSAWHSERTRAEMQKDALLSKIEDIDISLTTIDQKLASLEDARQHVHERRREYAEIEERVARARNEYRRVEGTIARIDPAINAAQKGRLVQFSADAASVGGSLPVSPKARNIVVLSLLIGLAAGAIFVVLAEVMDHEYRSSGQVARSLGLPILDAIDEIITNDDRRRFLIRRLVVGPVALAFGLAITLLSGSMAYLSLTRPTTYEKLRKIPESALEFFAGRTAPDESPDSRDVS